MSLQTPLTEILGIKHPIMLAGMGGVAGPELAAAVSNAGGIGTIGGGGFSPNALSETMDRVVELLDDKNAPFGVDLLLPQVGGSARKTNYDYTGGKLDVLSDIIISKGAKLFVCAVGVPPRWLVDKLHAAGIVVMNMVGAVKHVKKALDVGVDVVCAQGGEGGGHTGDVPTSILLPKVVDACRGHVSPLNGKPIVVVGAGGIFDGRGLASSLSCGAGGVWVGTRFIACTDANAGPYHQQLVAKCGYTDTVRTLLYTGRPARAYETPFIKDWHENRVEEMTAALEKGIVPVPYLNESEGIDPLPKDASFKERFARRLWLMGQCAGAIEEKDIKSAKEIIDEMVTDATTLLNTAHSYVVQSKL